jgi:hypothetical protein
MHNRHIFLFFIVGSWFLNSCSINDNENPIPAFVKIADSKVVLADGSVDTDKVTDIWAFADGQILGVFPLPAMIPITLTGSDIELTLLAGIRNNGINDTPVFYPFYKSDVRVISPDPEEVISFEPAFQYVSTAKIPVNEGFEGSNSLDFDLDSNDATNMSIEADDSAVGSRSGLIELTSSLSFIEVASQTEILAGENARGASYLELDYKGEGEISIGLAKRQGSILFVEYLVFVPGKQDWNKIYIDLTDKLSPRDYDGYRIAIGFRRTGFSATSKIWIDNVKHVHF